MTEKQLPHQHAHHEIKMTRQLDQVADFQIVAEVFKQLSDSTCRDS